LERLGQATGPVNRGLLALDRAADGLRGQVDGMAGRLGLLGDAMRGLGPLGVGAAASVAALAGAITAAARLNRQAIDSLSSVGDVAERIGVTAEALQELRFAAEQNNVATGNLDKSLQGFVRRVGEAQQGTGELLESLRQYNIEIKNADGSSRSAIQVFRDFANAVKGVSDPQEQLRLAVKAFGDEGAALVRLLRQGADGFDDLARTARESGAVFRDDVVANALAAGDELNRLEKEQEAALIRIGLVFDGAARAWEQSKTSVLSAVADIASGVLTLLADTEAALSRLGGGEFTGALDGLPPAIRRRVEDGRAASLAAAMGQLGNLPAGPPVPGASPQAPRPPLPPSRKTLLPARPTAADRQREALIRRGAQLTQNLRTPLEDHRAAMVELNDLLAAGAITSETFGRASEDAFERLKDASKRANEGLNELDDANKSAALSVEAAWQDASRGMTQALADFFRTGQLDFAGFLSNVAAALVQAQLNRLVVEPFGQVLGGFGNFLGNLFGGVSDIGPTGLTFANELALGLRPLEQGGVIIGGRITPFARGGVVGGPTIFPMANGLGLMGEAGPEAVMPLQRGPDGRLGVGVNGGGGSGRTLVDIQMIDQRGAGGAPLDIQRLQRPDGGESVRVVIRDATRGLITGGAFDREFDRAFGLKRRGA